MYCPSAVSGFQDLEAAYAPHEFAAITWYATPPYFIPEGSYRFEWYECGAIPWAWFDGYDDVGGGIMVGSMFPEYDPVVSAHLPMPSPLELWSIYHLSSATEGTLFVHVDVVETVTTTDNLVHFIVCESGVDGMVNLARLALADEPFTPTEPGDGIDVARPFVLDPAWNPDEIEIVVFVQSHGAGRQVLQANRAFPGRGMRVSPSDELHAVGEPGGPFSPAAIVYTIENLGPDPITCSVTPAEPWLDVSGCPDMLDGHGSAEVWVELTGAADDLEPGLHTAGILFVNETEHIGDTTRDASIEIGLRELVVSFPMDEDPGWLGSGHWDFGQPLGRGGAQGGPDPTSGHTGTSVFGYNLDGDYDKNIPTLKLTSAPIDCSNVSGATLRFWRWLGVEDPAADHAYVSVSDDGEHWTIVWENDTEVTDAEWTRQEFDISGVADGEPTVYLRWTMGPTDNRFQYCGWNIDDVEIWGIAETASGVEEHAADSGFALLPNRPNPFGPLTTIAFAVPSRARVDLRVYDVSGRLVRVLGGSEVDGGRHAVVWDGRDDLGSEVASGVYFCRMEAGGFRESVKMVRLR